MINALWWLLGIVLVTVLLFMLALTRKPQPVNDLATKQRGGTRKAKPQHTVRPTSKQRGKHTQSSKAVPPDRAVQALYRHVCKQLAHTAYVVQLRQQHVLISQQGSKVAMLTMDKQLATGTRQLGEVIVINYNKLPDRMELLSMLHSS